MDIVDNITISEAESMSNVYKNSNLTLMYSLSQQLQNNKAELAILEKKIVLGNDLLNKVNNPTLLLKLEKEKEKFEEQKINLTILIKKMEFIADSIKDFTLFFIFIRRFYTLAIQKDNFENKTKKISANLISKLKFEEENLYHEYVDGDCFSKVLQVLSFESYQSYFNKYAKNFFENIQHSNDPYVNALLRLQAIFYECTYFNKDNFNLTEVRFFLSKNIPINIPLPDNNYELVALRCFFFYELLLEFLKFKTVETHFEYLKKTVNLQLKIVNYKASTKNTLIFGLNSLREVFGKIEKKYNDFLGGKTDEDKEADANKALIFYNKIEAETQAINKKTINLINNKYIHVTRFQRMLAIIVNETHLPKFLELFNTKVGNDLFLNNMRRSEFIETNSEALNYLFHAICRDEFYTPLNDGVNSFISEVTKAYSKEDTSVLDNITLEDLIDFSFYYIFTLLYTDFKANLKAFNSKLLYTELVALSVFTNIKLEAIEVLEKRKNAEIDKFIERIFKNKIEYNLHKKNILEEIKLNLEIIQDTRRILSDTKSLENSLIPQLDPCSLVPMPENNLLIDYLKALEKKQKICELEYQKIEKHNFINKSKSVKTNKANEVHVKNVSVIEYEKAIEFFYETLNCLTENLFESLKHIKEYKQDKNQFRQKISSASGQIASSIPKLLSGLNDWKNINETPELASLSLPKLLELLEALVLKNTLIVKKDHKKKLTQLQELLNKSFSSIEFLIGEVNSLISEYHNYNHQAKKIIEILSTSFIKNPTTSQFFDQSLTKNMKRQINGKLSNDYRNLKEQSNWLEKIIRLIKCDTHERVIKLYNIIVEADDYQRACEVLNDKIKIQRRIKEKDSEDDNNKVTTAHSIQSINENVEKIPIKSLNEQQSEKFIPSKEKPLSSQDMHTGNVTELSLVTEVLKSTDECNKIRRRLAEECTNKERAKADLKAVISGSRYNFLISRIDPLNPSIPTTSIETNIDNNHFWVDPAVYSPPAPVIFYSAPPTIVEDTFICIPISRTVYHPL